MLIKKELVIVKDQIGLAQLEVSIINNIYNTDIAANPHFRVEEFRVYAVVI